MFFTLSLGFGALSSFASFMPYKNQCMRDAYTVVFVNCGTSLFAGIVVFSILGYREIQTGIDAAQVHYFLTLYTPSSKSLLSTSGAIYQFFHETAMDEEEFILACPN